jgi:hypothetical protein
MRTRIARLAGGAALALGLLAGGAGMAHADVVLGTTTSGGQTCTDYMDEHGHIYQVCHAPVDPSPETLPTLESQAQEKAQKYRWERMKGLNWPVLDP